ncbi:FAD binding domain family protein [Aspergillus niger]|nr:FAD binding domain family protein [Aspergillus niger]
MTRTPAAKYISLTNALEPLDPAEVDHIYSELEPADPALLEGEWDMHVIDTGHPAQALAEDILPLLSTMDFTEDAEKVHKIKFHGAAGSLIIPDDQNSTRRFRYVDVSTIAATNGYRAYYGNSGVLHFYLTRAEDSCYIG